MEYVKYVTSMPTDHNSVGELHRKKAVTDWKITLLVCIIIETGQLRHDIYIYQFQYSCKVCIMDIENKFLFHTMIVSYSRVIS